MIYLKVLIFILIASVLYAYEACYHSASVDYDIPVSIIKIIASRESSNNPYALNYKGKSFYFDNKSEAQKKLLSFGDHGKYSYDIGLMQINKYWFDKYNYPYELGLDPCFAIHFGAFILHLEFFQHGYNWDSVGRYHSGNINKRKAYLKLLVDNYKEKL